MDNTFNLTYLLHTPISYLLQEHSQKDIEQSIDQDGWNIFHYAIAELNISKVKELLYFDIKLDYNSCNNKVSKKHIFLNEKRKQLIEEKHIIETIPFSKSGYTPIHLSLFIYDTYSKLSNYSGKDFFYEELKDRMQNIINLLISKNTLFIQDCDGKTILDYAFLLENNALIDLISNKDPELKSLNKVSVDTAINILNVMKIKNIDFHEHTLNILKSIKLRNNLNKNLQNHQSELSKKINKV